MKTCKRVILIVLVFAFIAALSGSAAACGDKQSCFASPLESPLPEAMSRQEAAANHAPREITSVSISATPAVNTASRPPTKFKKHSARVAVNSPWSWLRWERLQAWLSN